MTQSCVLVGCGPRFSGGSDDTCGWVEVEEVVEDQAGGRELSNISLCTLSVSSKQSMSVSHGLCESPRVSEWDHGGVIKCA